MITIRRIIFGSGILFGFAAIIRFFHLAFTSNQYTLENLVSNMLIAFGVFISGIFLMILYLSYEFFFIRNLTIGLVNMILKLSDILDYMTIAVEVSKEKFFKKEFETEYANTMKIKANLLEGEKK